MSVFNSIQGTTLINWRIGLTGPTVYTGSADPTVTPPTPLLDGFRDGDFYIRASTGDSTLWIRDSGTFTPIFTAASGGQFDADIIMGAGARIILDDAVEGAAAPPLTFDGDLDTGVFQNSPNEISFTTGGIEKFIIESDGTLASTTASYETLVLADNDIPNRKYVEDTFVNVTGDSVTGNIIFTGTARMLSANGTVLLPSIGFASDLDTGFMLDTGFGVNSIGISSGGALVGDFTPDGLQMRNGAQVIGDLGSAAIPSYSFTSDLNTGLFSDGTANQFAISTAGVSRWIFNASGNYVPSAAITYDIGSTGVAVRNIYTDHILAEFGAGGDPPYSFDGDTDTGMYRSGANELSFSTGASQRWFISSTGHFIAGSGSMFDIGSTTVPVRDIYAVRNVNEIGSGALPSYTFDGDVDTGMYHAADNRIGFSTNGVQRVLIDNAFFDINVPITAQTLATAAVPSYTWDGNNDAGMFLSAADVIGFSTIGIERATISSTAITSTVPFIAPSGSAAAPAYSFSAATDTGFFLASHLNASVGGVNTWRFSTNTNFIGVQTGSNTIQALDSTQGATLSLRGGVSLGGGNAGGSLNVQGGTGNIAGAGGTALFRGGQGGSTGAGGVTTVTGGPGGPTSGIGGDLEIQGGATSATATEDGGDVLLSGGVANGSGTDGVVRITNSALKLVVGTKASLPGSLGAAGAPEAGLLQFVTDDTGSTAFVLAYSDSGPTWKRIDDNTNIA